MFRAITSCCSSASSTSFSSIKSGRYSSANARISLHSTGRRFVEGELAGTSLRASDGETQSKDRVKNKDHAKISTIVQPDDLEGFFTRYADVCKASMLSPRKRDRRKRKADKGKKKKGAETAEKKG